MEIQTKNQSFLQDFDPKMHDTVIIAGWLIGKAISSQKTYKKVIRAFFEFYPKLSIAETTAAHITVFLKAAEQKQIKATTLNLYLNTLASLFQYAQKQRKISLDPTAGLKCYRIENVIHRKVLYLDQVKQMISKTKRPGHTTVLSSNISSKDIIT
jgi:site-specific recombinase XerD